MKANLRTTAKPNNMNSQGIILLCKRGIVNLLIVGLGLMAMSFDTIPPAANSYQVLGSKAFISGAGKISDWKLPAEGFSCQGSFSTNGEELEDISGLRFTLPISQLTSDNKQAEAAIKAAFGEGRYSEIVFEQKNVMILPIMKMVHLVGEIKIGTSVHNVPMQMQYIIGEDGSMTLVARQFVKLSEFGIRLPNVKAGDIEEEITINITMKLDKKQALLASTAR